MGVSLRPFEFVGEVSHHPFLERFDVVKRGFAWDHPDAASVQPYPAGEGVRCVFDDVDLQGIAELVLLSDESYIAVNDVRFLTDTVAKRRFGDTIVIGVRMRGHSTDGFGDLGACDRVGPVCMLEAYPDGMERSMAVRAGERLQSVGVYFSRAAFADLVAPLGENCGRFVEALFDRRGDPNIRHLTVSADMWRAVQGLLASPHMGKMRTLFAQAKAMELICLVGHVLETEGVREPAPVRLLASDRRNLHEIRELLCERFRDPPSIGELTRLAGMNRNKLIQGFKHLFGVYISDFCHEKRMERGWEMLRDPNLPISEISYELGYAYPQNFSHAFRQHFGASPKEVRQRFCS